MNELKPVACRMKRLGEEIFIANEQDAILFAEQGWVAESVYIIPDTHRVVSAEFLKVVEMIVTEARDYYSDMNDNVCQSYADPWEHAADVCIELRAIIDNKEQS